MKTKINNLYKVINFNRYPLLILPFLTNKSFDKIYKNTIYYLLESSLPWQKIIDYFERLFESRKKKQGRPRVFSIRTEISILIIKAIEGYTDAQLLEALSRDIVLQRFARVSLLDKYTNPAIISDIRKRYAEVFNYEEFERMLAEHWNDYLELFEGVMMDATVFESRVMLVRDIELLHRAIIWIRKRIKKLSLKLNRGRDTYNSVSKQYKSIRFQRKVDKNKLKKLKIRQIRLLSKYIETLEQNYCRLTVSEKQYYEAIKQLYEQQKQQLGGKPVNGKILSLYKPYLRAIYRGKYKKQWEVGQKYHLFKIGELVFVDYVSNENYNESKRLAEVINKAEAYISRKPKYISADGIYSSRENRKLLDKLGIKSNFRKQGRPYSDEQKRREYELLIESLERARYSQLEGFIGHIKTHYYVNRVREKSKEVEVMEVVLATMINNAIVYGRWKQTEEKGF